ncbi:MAG TPA: DUF1684 domain-containing protein [Ferruginibacter sp.]|nr:DUF1684 domain-containing protein [Ferruginibacter sp.]
MQRISSFLAGILICTISFAQKSDSYARSIQAWQKNYVITHEVVKQKDKKYFHFFPVNKALNVSCIFEKITDTIGFTMKTSANTLKHYYKYGKLNFKISGKDHHLFVYQGRDLMQSKKYRDYLFVPFADETSGDETYGSGRYLEFYIRDIKNNKLQLDFNKGYNPYCAYSPDYKCPIPPVENFLPVAIRAGEMNFGKAH